MKRVLGYYADWATRLSPEQIDYSLFTHLCYAFAPLKSDGSLDSIPKAKVLCSRANVHGVKALLSVGGEDSNRLLTMLTASTSTRNRMIDSLMKAVDSLGFAGIDVDWEALGSAADQDRLNLLVTRLRERLGKERLLTMAAPSGEWEGKWFDTATLLPRVDWLNVMNYDYHGSWSERAGHNANLYPYPGDDGMSDVASLAYWTDTRKFPREKLLLGIPCFGQTFPATALGARWDKRRKAPQEVEWHEITPRLRQGWKRRWDSAAHVPYLLSPRGDTVISYEDADSAREKGAWAKKQGLGGIFFWEISQDFTNGSHEIVRSARRGLFS